MKTILWAILGVALAVVSWTGSKTQTSPQYDGEIAKFSVQEEEHVSQKRHNRW